MVNTEDIKVYLLYFTIELYDTMGNKLFSSTSVNSSVVLSVVNDIFIDSYTII